MQVLLCNLLGEEEGILKNQKLLYLSFFYLLRNLDERQVQQEGKEEKEEHHLVLRIVFWTYFYFEKL
jgi:hypothetical protein